MQCAKATFLTQDRDEHIKAETDKATLSKSHSSQAFFLEKKIQNC